MITDKNKWKVYQKILCECKCKLDGRKCNWNQKWNNSRCWCKCKKHHIYEKNYIWNPATYICKNSKHLASITDDWVIRCDEIIEEIKTVPTYFNEKSNM